MSNVIPFRARLDPDDKQGLPLSQSPVTVGEILPQRLGYLPKHAKLHRIYNAATATALVTVLSPVLATIAAGLLVTQGPRILTRADHFGQDKAVFGLWRFKTERAAKASDRTRHATVETAFGRYLRATRLDRLPQLFNVIRGDMNLAGPRPATPLTATRESIRNPHYDVRFGVRPGLVGPTQAYMCHGTSTRHEAMLDYQLCRRGVNYKRELLLLVSVGGTTLRNAVTVIRRRLFDQSAQRIAFHAAQDWHLRLLTPIGSFPVRTFRRDQISCAAAVPNGDAVLEIATHAGGVRRVPVMLTSRSRTFAQKNMTVEPRSAYARHAIDRYVRSDAVMCPPKPDHMPIWYDQTSGMMIDLTRPAQSR